MAEAQLNLSFKPDPNANITYLGNERKDEESKSRSIKVMFRANPQPKTGYWYIGNSLIPIGEYGNISSHFKSSSFSDGDLEGEYQVTLDFSLEPRMADEKNLLSVTNDLGTTNYSLDLTTFLDTMQVRNTDLVEHSSTTSTVFVNTVTLGYQDEEDIITTLSYDPIEDVLPSQKMNNASNSNSTPNYALILVASLLVALATLCCLVVIVSTFLQISKKISKHQNDIELQQPSSPNKPNASSSPCLKSTNNCKSSHSETWVIPERHRKLGMSKFHHPKM